MKRVLTLGGLLLVILLAGSGCHNIRHDGGDIRDAGRMMRMRIGESFRHNRGMRYGMMGSMHPGMGRGMMRGMRPGMGMMNGMGMMPGDSLGGMPFGIGRRVLESIPNVTENQKKQIEDLNAKNQNEMKKLREEMSAKMKDLMENHRKEILNILSSDQKKFIESKQNRIPSHP